MTLKFLLSFLAITLSLQVVAQKNVHSQKTVTVAKTVKEASIGREKYHEDYQAQYDCMKSFLATKSINADTCEFNSAVGLTKKVTIFRDNKRGLFVVINTEAANPEIIGYNLNAPILTDAAAKDYKCFGPILNIMTGKNISSADMPMQGAYTSPFLSFAQKQQKGVKNDLVGRLFEFDKIRANEQLARWYCLYLQNDLKEDFYFWNNKIEINSEAGIRTIYNLLADNFIITLAPNYVTIDGYDNDFVHITTGDSGSDGYYKNKTLIGNRVLCICKPFSGVKDTAKIVSILTPGTLEENLTKEEQCHLTSLTISGKLNEKDITLIRHMLGAENENYSWMGHLRNLDIADVEFVHAKGMAFDTISLATTSLTFSGRSYLPDNFGKITEDRWNEIKKEYLFTSNYKSKEYELQWRDSVIYKDLILQKGTISQYMFSGCINLKKITLPKTTKSIGAYAFADCAKIESIDLGMKTTHIWNYAFTDCISLNSVSVHTPKITHHTTALLDAPNTSILNNCPCKDLTYYNKKGEKVQGKIVKKLIGRTTTYTYIPTYYPYRNTRR